MARVVDRGEPCVRKWHRDKCFPQEAADKWIDYLWSIGDGKLKPDIDAVMEEPFRVATDAYKWQVFCRGIIANEDAFLPYSFDTILSHSAQWLDAMSSIRKLEEDKRLDAFKERLLSFEGPRLNLPAQLQVQIAESCNWEGLRSAITWLLVENFIYALAMAEAECLWLYHRIKEPKISRIVLPKVQKGKVQYPIKLFFGYFFDNLVAYGFHRSLNDIAGKIPRVLPLDKAGKESGRNPSKVDKDSGWREIKRAKYQGKSPSFETFRAWVDALIPSDCYPSPEGRELDKQLLCDALGAARIIEKFFREASKDISKKELLTRFKSYDAWYRFHSSAIFDEIEEGPGESQTPPRGSCS